MAEAADETASVASASKYYGRCCRCDSCQYLGIGELECRCGHPTYTHVKLSSCTECDCQTFESPVADIASCYHCGHASDSHHHPGSFEVLFLEDCVLDARSQAEMLQLYEKQFRVQVSLATLQRKLAQYGIRKTQPYSDEEIRKAVKMENDNGIFGYRRLHTALRTKHRMFVSRDRVHEVVTHVDIPQGHDSRIMCRKLHTKKFVSEGPNYLWSVDGHEKLAQPFGLYIYGVIDTFSRKVMALTVLRDKKAETIIRWLLEVLDHYQFMPHRIMVDKGSEWAAVKDQLNVIQMTSVFNQKIEAFWSQFARMSDSGWYKKTLIELENGGHFQRGSSHDRQVVFAIFGELLQRSLITFRNDYNCHRIRKQKNVLLPTGYSPNVMWDSPHIFNVADYREPFNPALLEALPTPVEDFAHLHPSCISKNNCVERYLALRENTESCSC